MCSYGRGSRAGAPDGVGDGPLDDDAHPLRFGRWEDLPARSLVHQVERGLQGVELPAVDGPFGVLVVPGVADEARLPGCPGVLQRPGDVAALQHVDPAGVQLHEVEAVGVHQPQAAVDAVGDDLVGPVFPLSAGNVVPGLGRQQELVAAVRHGLAHQLFADAVAGRGVEEVDACVQRRIEDAGRLRLVVPRQDITDLRQADPEAADFQPGLSQRRGFHGFSSPAGIADS